MNDLGRATMMGRQNLLRQGSLRIRNQGQEQWQVLANHE